MLAGYAVPQHGSCCCLTGERRGLEFWKVAGHEIPGYYSSCSVEQGYQSKPDLQCLLQGGQEGNSCVCAGYICFERVLYCNPGPALDK